MNAARIMKYGKTAASLLLMLGLLAPLPCRAGFIPTLRLVPEQDARQADEARKNDVAPAQLHEQQPDVRKHKQPTRDVRKGQREKSAAAVGESRVVAEKK